MKCPHCRAEYQHGWGSYCTQPRIAPVPPRSAEAYVREYPTERVARDVRLLTIGGGTSEIMKEIIARELKL